MSAEPVVNDRQPREAALIALLEEYTGKLRDIQKAARRRHTNSTPDDEDGAAGRDSKIVLDALQAGFIRLRPALLKLAQHVSQLIEHADLEDTTRLELLLRGAELEGALAETEHLLLWLRSA